MRRNSQIIVLLDVMFIFLFILIIKPAKNTFSLEFANTINIPNTKILAISNNNILFLENGIWIDKDITLDTLKYQDFLKKTKGRYLLIDGRELLNKLPLISKDYQIKTLVYDDLHISITSQGFIECTIKNNCKENTRIFIGDEGYANFNKKRD